MGDESNSLAGLATLFGGDLFSSVGNLIGLLGLGLAADGGAVVGLVFDLIRP